MTTNARPRRDTVVSLPARIADAHVHLWNLGTGIDYSWLEGPDDGPLGRISEIRLTDWAAGRFSEESRHARPDRVVHVQASNAPTDAVDETTWLEAEAARYGLPDAIVGRVDLRSPDLEATIERHRLASPRFCGVRDMTSMGALADPGLEAGVALLERLELSWEASCTWEEMPRLLNLALQHPGLPIVLGHAGWPSERDSEYFAHWANELGLLGSAPNVICKVSGLGMADHTWTIDSWRPWIEECLDAFGASRCMFGSNWPVERIYASYDAVVNAYASILSDLSGTEADEFWFDTAARSYGLNEQEYP